jgi:hypothetical protein
MRRRHRGGSSARSRRGGGRPPQKGFPRARRLRSFGRFVCLLFCHIPSLGKPSSPPVASLPISSRGAMAMDESEMRRRIVAIMMDTTLTEAEKAVKRQELMCGKWMTPKEANSHDSGAGDGAWGHTQCIREAAGRSGAWKTRRARSRAHRVPRSKPPRSPRPRPDSRRQQEEDQGRRVQGGGVHAAGRHAQMRHLLQPLRAAHHGGREGFPRAALVAHCSSWAVAPS